MLVLDDSTPDRILFPAGTTSGLMLPRSRMQSDDYAYSGIAQPFPSSLLIPRHEWQARIEEQEEQKSTISDLVDQAGLPHKDQGRTNYCFPAGTLVRMADGSNKPIEDVKVLDEVLTAEGNVRRVLSTIAHHTSEPITCLKVWGHNHLKATPEHPILTKRGYVPIGQLRIGDKVAFPKYAPQSSTIIQTGDFLYDRNHGPQSKRKYRNGSRCTGSTYAKGIPGKTSVTITATPVPDAIRLTPEFGRVAGFYLAEGHTSPCTVYFSFNATEEHTLAAECASLIRKSLGCEPHVRIRARNVCQVSIHGAGWAKLFDALFSRGSNAKALCPELASGPKDFLRNVLSGWMDGDRHHSHSAVSVSRKLALGMFDIANAHGLMPVIGTHQNPKIGRDGRPRQHSWLVGWAALGNVNHQTEQDETHLWRTVRGLEQEEFSGYVFNLHVEGDNSYVTEGIGVHNCWFNNVTHCVEVLRVIQNQPMVLLSPASGAAQIKKFRNVGGWSREALEWVIEHGIAPVDLWPANAIDKKYLTEEAVEAAKRYLVTEWWELRPRNIDELISCLLHRIPVATGYDWWGHAISVYQAVWLNGMIGTKIRNSWKNYGDNGYAVLQGNKMVPDDAVAPRVVLAA